MLQFPPKPASTARLVFTALALTLAAGKRGLMAVLLA